MEAVQDALFLRLGLILNVKLQKVSDFPLEKPLQILSLQIMWEVSKHLRKTEHLQEGWGGTSTREWAIRFLVSYNHYTVLYIHAYAHTQSKKTNCWQTTQPKECLLQTGCTLCRSHFKLKGKAIAV